MNLNKKTLFKILITSFTAGISLLSFFGSKNVNADRKLLNPNAPASTMPIYYDDTSHQYIRSHSRDIYFEGIKATLTADGTLSENDSTKNKSWLSGKNYAKRPELNLLYNDAMSTLAFHNKYKYSTKYVNIKKLYKDVYHVNIDKLISKTRPSDWKTKYKNGLDPKIYMVKGYTIPRSLHGFNLANYKIFQQYFPDASGYKSNNNKRFNQFKKTIDKLTGIEYTDQRQFSDKNNFNSKSTK